MLDPLERVYASAEMPKSNVRAAFPAVLACLVLGLLGASPARGAPTWLSPASLSEAGQNAGSPQVAVDAQGDAVAIWDRFDGSDYIVQATVRPAGGTWQTPVNLSEAGQESGTPQVTLDPQGSAIAVWSRGANRTVQAAVKPAGGAWSERVDLGEGGLATPLPHVAVDSRGNAVVVWVTSRYYQQIIQSAFRPVGGAWSAPVDISPTVGGADRPDIAINPQGEAVVTWLGPQFVEAAFKLPASGAWQAPVKVAENRLNQGGNPGGPQVAIDPRGDAVVTWSSTTSGSGANHVVQAAAMPAGGGWQTPVELSEAGADASVPHVALDSQGNATVVWSASSGGGSSLMTAAMPAGRGWQSPVELATATQNASPPVEPQIAVDAQGDAVAVWDQLNGTEGIIQAVNQPAGGAWKTPVNLSEPGRPASYAPQLAVDPHGNAVAVWGESNGGTVIQAAGYDAAGPLLNELSIPATGIAGEPLTFSVSPLDVWSALGATSWSFGDGTSASGTNVTHTYPNPGVYNVTLSSADVLGNTASTTATITITASSVKGIVSSHPANPPVEKHKPRINTRTGEITLEYDFPEPGQAEAHGEVFEGAILSRLQGTSAADLDYPLAAVGARHERIKKCEKRSLKGGKKCHSGRSVLYGRTTLVIITAGTYKLHIKPGRKMLGTLKRGQKLTIRLTLLFTPAGTADHISKATTVTVRLRRERVQGAD